MGGRPALISETFVAVELPGGADVLEVAIGLDARASLDTTEQEVATLVVEQIVLGLTDA